MGQPGAESLGSVLLAALADQSYTQLEAAVAFAKMSGVKHLARPLFDFRARAAVRMVVGIDQGGTSLEALQDLFLLLGGEGCDLFVLRNRWGNPTSSFHPKIWLFRGVDGALLIAGSGNLTGGGLYTNYEGAVVTKLDMADAADQVLCAAVQASLAQWSDAARPHIIRVTAEVLKTLNDSGELPSEAAIKRARKASRSALAKISGTNVAKTSGLFGGEPVPAAPPPAASPDLPARPVVPKTPLVLVAQQSGAVPLNRKLIMMVRPQQKTEIYLTKGVLLQDPAFFGLPFLGLTQPKQAKNPGQPQPDPLPTVDIAVRDANGAVVKAVTNHPLKMWTYSNGPSANDDFRITFPADMLAQVPNDSILVMERDPKPGVDFALTVFPPNDPSYAALDALCITPVQNSTRRYGWG